MTFPQTVDFWISQAIRFISPTMAALGWALVAAILLLMLLAPRREWRWTERVAARFSALASRKILAILICAILPIAIRVALLGIYPVHEPSIHDEFSHLLLADTLAHGRLSNPVHPLWMHFESIHIIQQPTYSSMYPPANGILLAVGQVVFHEPWAGELLEVALMFGALCWMMQQWLPAAWAFYGTLIAICRIGILSPWVDSYLGGPVSALGGALLIGAAPGLRKGEPGLTNSFLFGLGLVILMNSRPFDGAILSAAVVIYLLPSLVRRARACGMWESRRIWAPATALLLLGFAWTGYYSWRVTGHATKLPYQVNRSTYGWPENLAFLRVRKITQRHDSLRAMYKMEVARRQIFEKWNTYLDDMTRRLFENWMFFVGPLLTIPFLVAIRTFKKMRTGPLLAFIGLIACLNLFQLVLYPYHLGPVVPIIYTLAAAGLVSLFARIQYFRPNSAYLLLLALPACLITTQILKANADTLALPITYWERAAEPHGVVRAAIQHWLAGRPRNQLVFVRYAADHSPNQEWVYNGADIDHSKVVWAREMDPAANERLLDYFHDREVWLLEPDVLAPHVIPYSMRDAACGVAAVAAAYPCRVTSRYATDTKANEQ